MKKIIVTMIATAIAVASFAQGIVFNKDTSFQQALERAKAENKLIFLNCHAVWCGPCRWMAANVFTQEAVGEFFNANFINLSVDMERGEGIELRARFDVRAFPTLLLIRPDGTVQHRILGSQDAESLIARVKEGMQEETSFAYVERNFAAGNRNPELVERYVSLLAATNQRERAQDVLNDLFETISAEYLVTEAYWFLFSNHALTGWQTPRFEFLLEHKRQFRQLFGVEDVDEVIYEVFTNGLEGLTLDSLLPEYTEKLIGAGYFAGKMSIFAELELFRAIFTENWADAIRIYKKFGSDMSFKGLLIPFAFMLAFRDHIDAERNPKIIEFINLVEADRFPRRE